MLKILKISAERCHPHTYLNTRDNQLTTLPLSYITVNCIEYILSRWTLDRSS